MYGECRADSEFRTGSAAEALWARQTKKDSALQLSGRTICARRIMQPTGCLFVSQRVDRVLARRHPCGVKCSAQSSHERDYSASSNPLCGNLEMLRWEHAA